MSVQLPEDLRFPLYRERNRKDPSKPRKTQPIKVHDIGMPRWERRMTTHNSNWTHDENEVKRVAFGVKS
jgi:hypothetical protein